MSALLEKFKLDGKNAVVTGASSGIGRAMAGFLAAAGAHVVLVAPMLLPILVSVSISVILR